MSTKDFRAAVISSIRAWHAASFPNVPVFYENGPGADEASVGPLWLDVSLRWYGGSQAALGDTPRARHTGALSVQVFYRKGEGTGAVDDVIDSLIGTLQLRRHGPGLLYAAQRSVSTAVGGWHKDGVFIPFHTDT